MADQTQTNALPEALLVGLGAGLGAVTRYAVTAAVPAFSAPAEFALTLAINIVGCFLMGWLKPGPFFGIGFLGGFTTFSALILVSAQSSALGALVFIVVSFVACVCAWLAGDALRNRGAA